MGYVSGGGRLTSHKVDGSLQMSCNYGVRILPQQKLPGESNSGWILTKIHQCIWAFCFFFSTHLGFFWGQSVTPIRKWPSPRLFLVRTCGFFCSRSPEEFCKVENFLKTSVRWKHSKKGHHERVWVLSIIWGKRFIDFSPVNIYIYQNICKYVETQDVQRPHFAHW